MQRAGEEVRGWRIWLRKLPGFWILRIYFADWRILNAQRINISAWIMDFDSSSGEEETETDVLELDRGSTFLLGTTTRFGRQVRINCRLIS